MTSRTCKPPEMSEGLNRRCRTFFLVFTWTRLSAAAESLPSNVSRGLVVGELYYFTEAAGLAIRPLILYLAIQLFSCSAASMSQ